jgi:hypothetical protein
MFQIETRNNKLKMQEVNNTALVVELNKLLERLKIPNEASLFAVHLCSFHEWSS